MVHQGGYRLMTFPILSISKDSHSSFVTSATPLKKGSASSHWHGMASLPPSSMYPYLPLSSKTYASPSEKGDWYSHCAKLLTGASKDMMVKNSLTCFIAFFLTVVVIPDEPAFLSFKNQVPRVWQSYAKNDKETNFPAFFCFGGDVSRCSECFGRSSSD